MRRTNDRWSRYFTTVFIGTLLLSITAFFTVACVSTFFKDPRTPAGQEAIPGPNTAPVNDDFKTNSEKSSAREYKSKNKNAAPELSRRDSNGGKTLPADPNKAKIRKTAKKRDLAKKEMKKLKSSKQTFPGDKDSKAKRERFKISKTKSSGRDSINYQKSKGAKKMQKSRKGNDVAYNKAAGTRNIAEDDTCNSIQFEAFPDLNFALANSERLRSVAFANDDAYIAVTQNSRIGTHFFYYQGLGTDVINDIYDYFDDYGVKPSLVRLNPTNPNRHVAVYGSNGFSTTYPTNSQVFQTLDQVNDDGYYINDVALSSQNDSVVVIYRFNEAIGVNDYSGFTGNNIPSELYDELEFLYDSHKMVYQVAIGPIFPGFFEPSWIVSYGDGEISYYGIPNDVRNELVSVSNMGNRIENVAFDSQGGVLIHSIGDDGYEFQSLVQFQNSVPYNVQGPKLTIRNISSTQVELGFQSKLNEKYQIMTATNLSNPNWQPSGDAIMGNGLFKTTVRNKNKPNEFFAANGEFTPTCTRLAYRFYTEPNPETAVDELTCLYNGANYQPFNERDDEFIGKFQYGFSSLATCNSVINNASASGVCNWNGAGYSPYNIITGDHIGREDYGFQSLNDCMNVTSNGRNNAICNWNGSSYSPYYSTQNLAIGKSDFGYNTLSGCVDAVAKSTDQVLCNWNGSGYQPYYVDGTGQVGKVDYGFGAYATCNTAISKSSTHFACNWNGIKTQPYAFDNNVAVLDDDLGFSFTDDCFNTTAVSEARKRVCHPYQGDYARFKSSSPKVPEAGSNYFFYQQCVDSQ